VAIPRVAPTAVGQPDCRRSQGAEGVTLSGRSRDSRGPAPQPRTVGNQRRPDDVESPLGSVPPRSASQLLSPWSHRGGLHERSSSQTRVELVRSTSPGTSSGAITMRTSLTVEPLRVDRSRVSLRRRASLPARRRGQTLDDHHVAPAPRYSMAAGPPTPSRARRTPRAGIVGGSGMEPSQVGTERPHLRRARSLHAPRSARISP